MEMDFCEYCNASLTNEEKPVTVYRHRQEKHFIFENVPARVCPRCGERYFASSTVREMDQFMRRPGSLTNLIQVPVIALKPAA
jgi:YgiT-type zinc finger domain-containing protein